MNRRRLAACILCLAASLLASPLFAVPIIRTVDTVMPLYTSLQLNASGFPVVGYADTPGASLKVAVCGDALCTTSTITTVDNGAGAFVSLQLDANGFPVMSYFDSTHSSLKLAACGDATCTARTLATVDPVAVQGTSLRLDSNGFPAISYFEPSTGSLKIARCADPVCSTAQIATIDDTVSDVRTTSLALNAAGSPVISYYDQPSGILKLAVCSDATCTTSTVTTVDGFGGGDSSLQLDAGGNPVISYYYLLNQDLKLAVCADATCTAPSFTVVDSANQVGSETSMRLNGSGFPIISYFDITNQQLKLAVCADVACASAKTSTVDAASLGGEYSSLQLTAAGYPVISYAHYFFELRLAIFVPATVASVTVPSAGTYGVGQDLDFTVNWSEPVTVSGSPQIAITIGGTTRQATYLSGSGTSALTFRAVVSAGDNDSDGISVGALSFNGGTITDAYGLAPDITLNSVGSTAAVLVDTQGPAVTSVAAPAARNYTTGQSVTFTVNWNEPAMVTGTPQLSLTIGGTTREAEFLSGSGTSALTFTYTVVAADYDDDGIAAGTLSLNGGTIRDAAGNDAALALNNLGSTLNVLVNAAFVVTPSAGNNGSISPSTPQAIAAGATAVFTVAPDPGYLAMVDGTCGGSLSGNAYTTNPINSACTVSATFTAAPTVTFTGPTATGTGIATASFTGGGPTCAFSTSQFIPLTGSSSSPPAGTVPAALLFPQGLFDFTTSGCVAGSTITMTITYPNPLPPGARYWKYGPTPSNAVPHWYVLPATISGTTASFSITDGGLGDDDLVANGTIADQGGPGVGGNGVPALSRWMLAILVMLIVIASSRTRHARTRVR